MNLLLENQTTNTTDGTPVIIGGVSDTVMERTIFVRGTWGGATATFVVKPHGDTEFTGTGTNGEFTSSEVKKISVRPGDTVKVNVSGVGTTSLTAGISN